MTKFYTAYSTPLDGEADRQKHITRLRKLGSGRVPREKTTPIQWERGKEWLDLVRPKIDAYKHPRDPNKTGQFLGTLPIPNSGSDYIDALCIELMAARLTRRANEKK